MKKIMIFVLCITFMLTGCSNTSDTTQNKTVDLQQLASTILDDTTWPSMAVLNDDEVFSILGLHEDLYEAQYVGLPLADVAGYRLIMIQAKDGRLDEVKKVLDEYIKLAKQQIFYPTAVENLDNALKMNIGEYYFLVVSEENDQVKALIEDAFN